MKKIIYVLLIVVSFSLFMMANFNLNAGSEISLDQCNKSTLFSNVVAQSTDLEEESDVECNCGLIWGTGCKSSNYGNTCWDGNICSGGAGNC